MLRKLFKKQNNKELFEKQLTPKRGENLVSWRTKKMRKVEFQIGELLGIGMTLVVLGIGLAYGLQVMGEIRDDMDTSSLEQNATIDAITGVAKIPEKLPTIATVIVASVIIGVLVTYLWGRFKTA